MWMCCPNSMSLLMNRNFPFIRNIIYHLIQWPNRTLKMSTWTRLMACCITPPSYCQNQLLTHWDEVTYIYRNIHLDLCLTRIGPVRQFKYPKYVSATIALEDRSQYSLSAMSKIGKFIFFTKLHCKTNFKIRLDQLQYINSNSRVSIPTPFHFLRSINFASSKLYASRWHP